MALPLVMGDGGTDDPLLRVGTDDVLTGEKKEDGLREGPAEPDGALNTSGSSDHDDRGSSSSHNRNNVSAEVGKMALDDMWAYMEEYRVCCQPCLHKQSKIRSELDGVVRYAVDSYKVVVFEKPRCGFCKRAKRLLSNYDIVADDLKVIVGSGPPLRRAALRRALSLPSLTFPIIFMNGRYLGGCEDIEKMHAAGKLQGHLDAEPTPFSIAQASSKRSRPLLCTDLAGSNSTAPNRRCHCLPTDRWWFFQIKSYANVVRAMSVVHIIIMGCILIAAEAGTTGGISVAIVLAALLGLDISLYILFGATPMSPIGNLSKLVVWNFRGNAILNLPYKIVFVIYVIAIANMVVPLLTADDALTEWKSRAASNRAQLISGIVNSSMLAMLRV